MASVELEEPASATPSEERNRGRLEAKREVGEGRELELSKARNGMMNNKKKNGRWISSYLPKTGFGCLRVQRDEKGNFDMEVVNGSRKRRNPNHLLVMVNGLVGRAEDWKFAAKQFLKTYPEDIIVHCSACNYSTLTLDGIDVMGGRLAEEIVSVIKGHRDVQKISFIGHSLGGLIARYAIGKLYEQDVLKEDANVDGECTNHGSGGQSKEEKFKGKIAGLEPVNFITCATPHLGLRGHKQAPLFCGFNALENLASRASFFLGRTGKHLYLIDKNNGKGPLLLQMTRDCEDLKFLSALRSFRHRVTYANRRYDLLVGWSTASIRHPDELPKLKRLPRDSKYPHIINEEKAKISSIQSEVLLEAKANGYRILDLEEEMIKGLTSVGWDRVDVDFSRSKQRYFAHNTIQVNIYCMNSDGATVIQHMIDNFLL